MKVKTSSLNFAIYAAIAVVIVVYFYSMASMNSDANRSLEDLNLIIDRLEKEHSEIRKLVNELDKEATEKMHEKITSGALRRKASTNGANGHYHKDEVESEANVNSKLISSNGRNLVGEAKRNPGPVVPFPQAITFQTTTANQKPATLVVGGTDGSGTRRVVQILTQLGVTMVSEDPETYDIHGDLMGGWPPVVKPVLQNTHSLIYEPSDLPVQIQQTLSNSLHRLIEQATADSTKPTSYKLAVGGALPKAKGVSAKYVQYGFKAPISVTLSPWWAQLMPDFKLLHVLRDGRDIAFSDNQGPVDKFYNDMYPGGDHDLLPIKAIRLWSDWNTQLYQWAHKKVESASQSMWPSGKSVSYFALHSEDLVSESIAVRFAALSQLAEWVGSDLSDERICCLAVIDAEFLGSHDREARKTVKSESQLSSRYGKWHGRVAHSTQLNASLHSVGGPGLKLFGYEPMRELAADNAGSKNGFVCDLTEEECGAKPDHWQSASREAASKWAIQGECNTFAGRDYKGDGRSDLLAIDVTEKDPTECCRRCQALGPCKFFTIDPALGYCYLKSGQGIKVETLQSAHLISGDVINK